MELTSLNENLKLLKAHLDGDLFTDNATRIIYATDASAYREMPVAVARPKNVADIKKLIKFATENHTSLIPRGAGTSLAGQVVGSGIVIDVTKYMNNIIEFNKAEHWIRVQPGVVLARGKIFNRIADKFFAETFDDINDFILVVEMPRNGEMGKIVVFNQK